jgi:hypothetical protein
MMRSRDYSLRHKIVIVLPAAEKEVSQVNQIKIPAGEKERRR